MPSLSKIRSTISEIPNGGPLVAVLPGGTTGIGSYVANSLARTFATQGSKLRVYIVGRNVSRAQSVIELGKQLSPGSDWRFVQGSDLSLISEVDKACAEVIKQETQSPLHETPSIDLLYMSFCVNIMQKQRFTSEGLDAFLSTVYYARIRFIQQLIPLLTSGPQPGHAISIYAGGFEDGTKPGQWPVGMPSEAEWGISSVRKHACFMKNFVFEGLAERHAGKLSLTHIYPGLVDGPGFYSEENPGWFMVVWPVVKLLSSFYMSSPEMCGDVMVYLASGVFPAKGSAGERTKVPAGLEVAQSSQGERGGGSYAVGRKGDVTQPVMYEKMRKEGTSKKIWDHTFDTLAEVEKKNTQTI